MAKVGRKTNAFQRTANLAEIAELYAQGVPQFLIARRVDRSEAQISLDLKKLFKDWTEAAFVNVDIGRAETLARIEETEAQAWIAFKLSQGKIETTTEKTGGLNGYEKQVKTEFKAGDSSFLRIVLDCCKQRREMFGLDKPAIVEDDESRKIYDLSGLTDSDIEKLANGLDATKAA